MIILLSPAKNMDITPIQSNIAHSDPVFYNEAVTLVSTLKNYSAMELGQLMRINEKLSILNFERYQNWGSINSQSLKQSIFAYNGEVFNGLKAKTMTEKDLSFAQEHLLILSGLYGLVRPLDLIQPYRLEMGQSIKIKKHKNLYSFWNNKITKSLDDKIQKMNCKTIINLSSIEYSKAIDFKRLNATVIQPTFKDEVNGRYKPVHVYLKKARGSMARFIIENQLTDTEHIKAFDTNGYLYNESLSNATEWVFIR